MFRFALSFARPLPAVLAMLVLGCSCEPFQAPTEIWPFDPAAVRLADLRTRVLSPYPPEHDATLRDLRLLSDAPRPAGLTLAVVRSIVRADPYLDGGVALTEASEAIAAAGRAGIDPGFFCATVLQESAFDPDALSGAGAVGIAQFTLDTADGEGVDPFDWRDSLDGAARLLARYVHAYDGLYDDPYAAALAAYNAGPGAVSYYRGVPPYRETREYIALIVERWSRLLRDANLRVR